MGELITACVAVIALAMMAAGARADELHILATGVFEKAVHDLAAPFRQQSGQDVRFTVVNAGTAAAKLEAGEAFDAVLSSSASLDALAAKGRVVAGSKVDVGRMRLGAGVKAGAPLADIGTAEALRAAILAAPAIAYIDPKGGGTSGVFFAKIFERLGIAAEVQAKGIPCATGTEVDKAVASGRASLGMTQASEIIGAEGVAFAGFLPDDLQLVTVYAAAIPAGAKAPEGGEAFIRFLTGETGAGRLRKSGWDVIGGR
jgi:molybdate transport system substrate-binding protein